MEVKSSDDAEQAEDDEQLFGLDPDHDGAAEQAADHHEDVIEDQHEAGGFDAAHALLVAVLDGDGGEGDFDADVEEDADHAEDGVGVGPDVAGGKGIAGRCRGGRPGWRRWRADE